MYKKRFFRKARKIFTYNLKHFKMKKTKQSDASAFKRCECEKLFVFIKDPKTNKVKICVGNNLVSSKEFYKFEDAEKYVKSKPYELMINVSCLFISTELKKHKENENKEV